MLVQVDNGDVGPLLGESDGDRAPDAAVAAGNDGDLVHQLACRPVFRIILQGPGLHLGLDAGLTLLMLGRKRLLLLPSLMLLLLLPLLRLLLLSLLLLRLCHARSSLLRFDLLSGLWPCPCRKGRPDLDLP